MCLNGSCSPSSVLKLKNTRSPFEWYSFYLVFIAPSSWPGCYAFADTKDCWGYHRAAAEPLQSYLLWPLVAAMVRPCRLHLCPKSMREYLSDFLFFQQMSIFQYSTLHCSLSLWVCKLLRLRNLVYCSLSHFHMTFY